MKLPLLSKSKKETPPELTSPLQDLLAPAAMKIDPSHLQLGEKFVRTLFVAVYPRYLSVSWFSPVINLDRSFDISIYIQPLSTGKVLHKFEKKVAQIGAQMSEKQEKGF